MGLRIIEISGEFLRWMHQGEHHYRMTVPLPDDAKVVNARFEFPQKVELLIESAEWSEVEDGGVIPHFDPMFQRIQGDS